MAASYFHCPPRIVFGSGSVDGVGEEAKTFGQVALVVTGKSSSAKSGALAKVTEALKAAGVTPVEFAEVESDPSVDTVDKGVALAREKGCGVIVALGGGSPLDAAKGIALLMTNPGRIQDYEGFKPQQPGMPIIAVPTTAGTGSEVTRFTVITDKERKVKMLIGGLGIIPKVALLDPQLTVSMPRHVTAATGLDALTHAIEAYISRQARPLTDVHALEAIRLIGQNLIKAVTDPENLEAREAMLLGQLHAGLAFSNASVALVHSMSRPLGARFGIPHGTANAILLAPVMAYNRPACPERFRDIARALGEQVDGLSLREASILAVEAVQDIFDETGLPSSIADYEVMDEDVPALAEDAHASGSTPNNPRKPTREDIAHIYRQVL